MLYLDSSAIVTLTLRRPPFLALARFLADHSITRTATSTIGFIEAVRTLDIAGGFPHAMRDLTTEHAELPLDERVRDAAAHLVGGIRSLDAIHVATAQALGDALTSLITYDRRMAQVARDAGLPVASPGMGV